MLIENKAGNIIRNGMSFYDYLFLLFLGLKLAGCLTWSWWVIFIPFIWPAFVLGVVNAFPTLKGVVKQHYIG